MQFDNSQFEKGVGKSIKSLEKLKKGLKLDEAAQSLSKLQKAGDSFSLAKIADGIDNLTYRFSWMGRTVSGILDNLTFKAKLLIKSMSVDQISAGWSKYADKTGYVQTIMNATGKSIDEVNKYLDKLMWFSDETSYGFVDMTQALGTLTSSGGDINKLIPMLEGMANATAFAGKSAAEFQRTMYNLNQSYSSGYMQYIDWKSVEMAGVGSEQLKQAFIDAGKALGTLTKEGKTKKGTLVSIANFGTTLNEKWADTKVMEKAFGTFSEMTEKAYDLIQEGKFDTASDAYAWLATQYTGVGITAAKAAQEAKSFNEAIVATTDAVSSGWMRTFEIIFGNYDEARVMWTDLANWLWNVFASGSEARNELLQSWKDIGGRTTMLEGIYSMFEAFNNLLYAIKDAWREVFPETTADDLMKISNGIKTLGDRIKEAFSYEETETVVDQFAEAVTGPRNPLGEFWGQLEKGAKGEDVKKLQQKLFDMGYDLGTAGIDGIFGPKTQEALQKFQKDSKIKPTGIFDEKTFDKLGESINEAFGKFTPVIIGETTENVVTFSSTLGKLRTIAKGAFSVLKIGWKTIKFLAQAVGQIVSVFRPLGDVVLAIFEKVAGSITKADEALDENGFMGALERLSTFLAPIRKKIQDFADAILIFLNLGKASNEASEGTKKFLEVFQSIKNWVSSLGIAEKFSGAITAIKNAVKDAWPIVQGFFETVGNLVGEKVSSGFSIVVDWLSEKIPIAIDAVVNAFKWLGDAIKSLFGIGKDADDNPIKETVDGFTAVFYDDGETESKLDKAKMFIEKVKDFFASIWDTVSGFFGEKFEGLKEFNPLQSFMTLIESIGNWFDTQFSKSWDGITEGIGKIGEFLAEHAGILIGAGGILIFFQLLKLVKVAFNVFNELVALKKLEAKAEIAKNTDPNKAAKLILAIAGAILSIAFVIKMLGGMDPASYAKGIFGLVLCVGAIVGLVIAFSILQKKDKNIDFKKIGHMLAQMGFAIGVVAASVFILGHMSFGQIVKGLLAVGAILALLIGTVRIFQKMNVKLGHGFNMKGMLELAGAIAILAGLAILLGYINFGKFIKGLGMLSLVVILLFGAMKILAKASDGSVNIQISGILQISLAIGLIAAMAWILGNADPGKWWRGFARLLAVSALIFGFVIILAKIGSASRGNVDIAIKGLVKMSFAIGILAGITYLLGKMDWGELKQGLKALAIIATILGLLIFVAGKFSSGAKLGPIITMTIGLGLLAIAFSYAIEKIKDVKWQTMIAFAGSMSLALGALVAACLVAGKLGGVATLANGALGIGVAFAIIIGIVGGIVALLGVLDELTGGKTLEVFEKGQKIIESIGRAIGSLFGGLISGIIDPVSDSIHALGTGLKEISSIQDLPGTLDKAMAAISTITLFVGSIEKEGIERNIGAIPRLFIGDNKTNSLLDQIKSFGETVKTISESLGGLGKTNISKDIEKAIGAATAIKDFIVGLQSVDIDYVKGGIAQWFQGKSKEETILGLIEKFGEAMASTATALSGMPANAEKLVNTATEAADKIVAFIATLKDRTDVETVEGVFAQWFQGETKEEQILGLIEKFGEAMGTSAAALKEMPNNASSLVDTATSAADKIIAFIETLDGRVDIEGTKTIFGKWFGGDSAEETILGLIEKFGTAMKETGSALKEMPSSGMESATKNAISAAGKIVDFITSLSTIEVDTHSTKIGDWLGGKSKQKTILDLIKDFGTSMSSVGGALEGLSEEIDTPLDNAIDAARKVSEFLDSLKDYKIESKKGALNEWFTGKTQTDSVISRIGDMGVSIKSLADSIPGISATTFSSDVDAMIAAYESLAKFINLISSDEYDFEKEGKASTLKTDIKLLGEGITDFASVTKDIDTTAVSSVANAMSSAMNSVMDVAMPEAAYKASSYLGLFVSVGLNMASGLAQGLRKNKDLAVEAARSVANEMLNAVRNTLKVHSPSRKFAEIGMYCDRGWAKGITKGSGLITDSVEGLGTSALDSARGSLGNLADILMSDMDSDPVIRPVIDMSDVNRSASRINGLVGGSRAMNIDATVRQAQSVAGIMNRNQMQNQNGTNPNGANGSDQTNPVNVSGNNFYIRSDNDVKMLANELATLTRQQQRSLGAAY
uniref:Tail tape measure n=1 Tax=Siphoviridae sp. ctgBD49 TaxID=2826420 RepID=A0A8S5QNS8_9CAUD|nr:MAG TPA: tail tape measure [Siphoviridae sp. ctgBD49]